ncbi:hypothetical protein [Celeribacter sp. ULVN23_4]
MSAQTTHAPHRSWGRIALVVVLGLSLLGNAVTFGVIWRFQQVRVSVMGDEGPDAARVPTFPSEIRKALRESFKEDEELQASLRDAIKARRDVVAVSTGEAFDKAATEAAMAEFRTQFIAAFDEMQSMVLGVLEEQAEQD